MYFVFAYQCDAAFCLKIVQSGWRNIYGLIYVFWNNYFIFIYFVIFLKLKANTHYEKQEHNSLQQIYF